MSASESGRPAAPGIAIGRAVVWARDPAPRSIVGTPQEEHARLARAIGRASSGVEQLVRLLPRAEAELFEPELAILAELLPALATKVDAGMRAEDAVNAATSDTSIDLFVDARARILDALAHDERSVEALLEGREGDRVLVTQGLTPSVVASLPLCVVGIVAASEDADQEGDGGTSHAAILARGRDIPLAFVLPEIVRRILDDDQVVLDTTALTAALWVAPDQDVILDAHARREARTRARTEEETRVTDPLSHLGLAVLVNIGSLHEHVCAAAEGIGLVRTELVFSDHLTAPSEAEQVGALRAIAARVDRAPVVVRLFDAGGDKPLPWLRAPEGGGARGIELLFMHSALLDTQLRALLRAAERADLRVLLPLVRCAGDVAQVRDRIQGRLPVGALIETPAAVDQIEAIAAASDFVCVGTNDLSAAVTGEDRSLSGPCADERVLRLIARIVVAAHARSRQVTVCGEMAGDPHCARILVGLGVDAISVATGRLAKVKLSLRDVSADDCRDIAREALEPQARRDPGR